jgi:catechol 2,3-dioxygenase-like lactoylglutathione lyase family enzyme
MRVTEINHIALHVADLERARRFYVEVLGFEDRTRRVNPNQAASTHQTMSFLVAGSQGLDLFEVPGRDVRNRQDVADMNHMALSVEEDDVSAVCAALQEAGVEASEKTPRNTIFISDPDGHRIEILPHQAAARQL